MWLAVAMLASGVQQAFAVGGFVDIMKGLGYPAYFSVILGIWKLLGVPVLLIPRFPLLKEWMYAGFFFTMSGALFSHLAAGHGAAELFAPAFLLALTLVSWHFRPRDKRLGA